jgi:hypothetical protein
VEDEMAITIKNVSIGDVFATGKHTKAVVVDFHQKVSMMTGETLGHACIAKSLGLAENEFEVAFATVCRNRIKQ